MDGSTIQSVMCPVTIVAEGQLAFLDTLLERLGP